MSPSVPPSPSRYGALKRKQPSERAIYNIRLSPARADQAVITEDEDHPPRRVKSSRPTSTKVLKVGEQAKVTAPMARSTRSHKEAVLLMPDSLSTKVGASTREVGGSGTAPASYKTSASGQRAPKIKAKEIMVVLTSSNISGSRLSTPVKIVPDVASDSADHKGHSATKATEAIQQKKLLRSSEDGSTLPLEGVSSILINPSPVKVPRSEPTIKGTQQEKKASGERDQMDNHNHDHDREASNSPSLQNVDEVEPNSPRPGTQSQSQEVSRIDQGVDFQSTGECLDIKIIRKLLDDFEKVGHTYKKKEDEWQEIHHEPRPYTVPGKRILRRLRMLEKAYLEMKELFPSEDLDALDKIHRDVVHLVDGLEKESLIVLEERLAPTGNRDKTSTTTLLTDMYFHILPNFVHVLKAGVELYVAEDHGFTLPALEELTRILAMIVNLAEAALKEPNEVQPSPKKKHSYQISKPTRKAMPVLRDLYGGCQSELKAREKDLEDAVRTEKQKKRSSALEKRRREDELLAEEERKQIMTEKARAQRRIIGQRLGYSKDQYRSQDSRFSSSQRMSFSQTTLEHMARQKERAEEQARLLEDRLREARLREKELNAAGKGELRSHPINEEDMVDKEVQDSDDPFDNSVEEDVQRVRLFGQKNKRASNADKSWSTRDKEIFIEVLRDQCSNPNKYELLSQRLDRSLDEIFDKVKEFKEAMDIAHEKGLFTDMADDWIEEILIDF